MVGDYMKLMDSKIQGSEEAFLSNYNVSNSYSLDES